jgi:hypothetical protein
MEDMKKVAVLRSHGNKPKLSKLLIHEIIAKYFRKWQMKFGALIKTSNKGKEASMETEIWFKTSNSVVILLFKLRQIKTIKRLGH